MTTEQTEEPTRKRSLRLWPGVVIVLLQWLARFGLPLAVPDAMPIGVISGLFGGLAILVWWVFFSRAPLGERLGAAALMIVTPVATSPLLHKSIATGMMGMMFAIYVVPLLSLAFVAWAVASRRLAVGPRRGALVATVLLACGVWTLVQTGGFTGDGNSDFAWRWADTAEDRLMAKAKDEPMGLHRAEETGSTGADWTGFRGSDRDGSVPGVQIETDWSASPPVELWRRPIGPGWSSFAVAGNLLYTQEQRGDDEVVASYRLTDGEPVWKHRDAVRFWESNAGAGPRGTPTLSGDRVFAFGATGILNVLDAQEGTLVWSRDAASDTETEIPDWGFSSSPLVVDDVVMVAAAGTLAAYDLATGDPRWFGATGRVSYSSPHWVEIDGVGQVLFLNGDGAMGVEPVEGNLLWQHPWRGYPIVQPALTADGDVLISVSDKSGLRRLTARPGSDGWTLEERWTSIRLKPYFNDFVVHEGHAFGFDGRILACIDLEDGERAWKGGRYGNGQLLLLPDQDLLLVLSELGELVLVGAASEEFTELARFPALEGKTWNHPVLAGDLLLVRNGQEMAAFQLPLASD